MPRGALPPVMKHAAQRRYRPPASLQRPGRTRSVRKGPAKARKMEPRVWSVCAARLPLRFGALRSKKSPARARKTLRKWDSSNRLERPHPMAFHAACIAGVCPLDQASRLTGVPLNYSFGVWRTGISVDSAAASGLGGWTSQTSRQVTFRTFQLLRKCSG